MRKRRVIATSSYAHSGYIQAMMKAGADEVKVIREDTSLREFDRCCGLLIPGGQDVSPEWYGEDYHPATQSPNFKRDALELALLKRALKRDMPILGVCRGHQLLNVACGGSLIQHLHGHVGYRHMANITCNAVILSSIPEERLLVNSLHHQAVDRLGDGLVVAAQAEDGTVEAIEGINNTFVVGVQWHPEIRGVTPKFDREMGHLVKGFVNAR